MGIAEEAKGKLKQAVGDLTGNEELRDEGEAQAHKGEAERQETQARANAKLHEKQADYYERKQEAAEE